MTMVFATICPLILAYSIKIIVLKATIVKTSIAPSQPTLAMFDTVLVITDIGWIIRPKFGSFSVLQIIFPFSFVFVTICPCENAIAFSFVFLPFSNVNIPICVYQATLALGHVIGPKTVIPWSILPYLYSSTKSIVIFYTPFPFIYTSILQQLHPSQLFFNCILSSYPSILDLIKPPVKCPQLL